MRAGLTPPRRQLAALALATAAAVTDAPAADRRAVSRVVTPVSGPSAAVSATAVALKSDAVLAIGLPSVIELRRDIFAREKPVCIDFFVQAIGSPVRRLRLTTSGIGHAWLFDLSKSKIRCDDQSPAAGAATLTLDEVHDAASSVRLMLETEAFPSSIAAKGQLLLLREGLPPIEVAVTLQREDHAPFVKAVLWFVGLLVPALMTGGLGLIVYRTQKRLDLKNAEKELFDRFRRDKGHGLVKFFSASGVFPVAAAREDDEAYMAGMKQALSDQGILDALPRQVREALVTALMRADRVAVADRLCILFPENKNAILNALPKRP